METNVDGLEFKHPQPEIGEAWKEASSKTPGLSPALDLSDRPRAVCKEVPFVFRMLGAALPFLSLSLFNILFFVLAWRRFLRYDVR